MRLGRRAPRRPCMLTIPTMTKAEFQAHVRQASARDLDSMMCQNQGYGYPIRVRCMGCNSAHSTKNIGSSGARLNAMEKNPKYTYNTYPAEQVFPERTIFDLDHSIPIGQPGNTTRCTCPDPTATGLKHECDVDDPKDNLQQIRGPDGAWMTIRVL
jgi:hypothetical protein